MFWHLFAQNLSLSGQIVQLQSAFEDKTWIVICYFFPLEKKDEIFKFCHFFNKNGNCSSQQAMYVVSLTADKIFLANWFNLTKKSQKTIFYGLKIEKN